MRTSFHLIRGGPLLLVALALLATTAQSQARDHAPQRFSIHGSLQTTHEKTTAASPWLRLDARLSSPSKDVGLASGGDFVMLAKLATSPLGCSVDDLIFANGFDNPGF